MRYPKDQKQATRQRILEAAGRRFKQDGIDGAGVAAVMSDAGLTNGAFLSPEHRDQSADGCPSAALLDEIARRPAGTKDVFTDELLATADDIAARLDPTEPDA